MNEKIKSLQDISDIRKMMERSSRFISLSGLSGLSAGICALAGAVLAYPYVKGSKDYFINVKVAIVQAMSQSYTILLNTWLFWIAAGTFIAAVFFAFLFTWRKSRQQGIPLWGAASRRLMMNLAIPLIVGGIFLIKLLLLQVYTMFDPGCLIFYGLALLNASKYTYKEIRYLACFQLFLGLINLVFTGYGIFFWAAGFGVLHIIYGSYMWWKYERNDSSANEKA